MPSRDHTADRRFANRSLLITSIPEALISRTQIKHFHGWIVVLAIVLTSSLAGCGPTASKKFEPIRYSTVDKLKDRLKQVVQYGDGGSSLSGIPESIEQLMKNDPEKGKLLKGEFLKLDTATDKETRKKIAQQMIDMLEPASKT